LIQSYNSIESGYNIQGGGAEGYGFICEKRSTDTPQYVSGFWFPSDRFARRVLNIPKRTYIHRKKVGTLGQVCITSAPKTRPKPPEVFIRDFWFPSNKIAQSIFNVSQPTISKWARQNLLGATT